MKRAILLKLRLFLYRIKMKCRALLQKTSKLFRKTITPEGGGSISIKTTRRPYKVTRPSFWYRKPKQTFKSLRIDQVLKRRKIEKQKNSKLFKRYKKGISAHALRWILDAEQKKAA